MQISKKIIYLIVFIVFLFIFPWKIPSKAGLMQDTASVESVKIVRIDDYNLNENQISLKTIRTVDDKTWFMEEFQKIRCNRYRYKVNENLVGMDNSVFKISYYNGDYELIDYRSRIIYTYKDGWREKRNIRMNQKQFKELLMSCMMGDTE